MSAKKFQSGGVYPVNPSIQTGNIPALPSPTVPDIAPFAGNQIATLARFVQANQNEIGRRQEESVAQQRYQDALASSTLDLNDKLFGPVHNDKQQTIIDQVKAENDIPQNFSSAILNNPILLKDMKRKLYNASNDSRAQKVFKEVYEADQNRKAATQYLDANTYPTWNDDVWSKYQRGEISGHDTNPAAFKAAKNSTQQEEFQAAIKATITDLAPGVDLNDRASVDKFDNILKNTLIDKNKQAALDLGLLVDNQDGSYSLSPGVMSGAVDYIQLKQNAIKNTADARSAQQKDIIYLRDSLSDQNYRERHSVPKTKNGISPADIWPNLTTAAALQSAGDIYDGILLQLPTLPPRDRDLIHGIENIVTQGTLPLRASDIENLIEALKQKPEVQVEEAKRIGKETQQLLEGVPHMGGSSITPTAVPPAQTPLNIPNAQTPTGQPARVPKFNPATGKVE